MSRILQSESYDLDGVRDVIDAREVGAEHFAAMAQQQREGRPQVGMQHRPRTGQGTASRRDTRCATRVDSRFGGRTGRDECDTAQPCHSTVLGWQSITAATFPLAGVAAGVAPANNGTALAVTSGNTTMFTPRKLFFEARDQAAAFAVVPTLLVNANISGTEQLAGGANAFGITSAVFALTNEPLPIDWDGFSDHGQQVLNLTFGNFLAAAVTIQVFGVFWGDRNP